VRLEAALGDGGRRRIQEDRHGQLHRDGESTRWDAGNTAIGDILTVRLAREFDRPDSAISSLFGLA
jgi:hypothetical protein